jgi:BON domain
MRIQGVKKRTRPQGADRQILRFLEVGDPTARIVHIARGYEMRYTTALPPVERQMRVVRRRSGSKSASNSRMGAVILSALAGVAVGMLLADRGTLDGLGSRWSARRAKRAERAPEPDADEAHDAHDATHHEDFGDDAMHDLRPIRSARVPRKPVDDEAELELRVLETFRNDPVLVDRPIDIGAIGTGIIELTGWVDTSQEIRHATTLTRGTIGVHTVVNRLLVRGDAPAA